MSKLHFYPNLTPREVIKRGAFGGCYFGFPIEEDTNFEYQELFDYHFKDLDTNLYLGETYKPKLNKFTVRSGMDYEYWKAMNWMHERDPYGWFEWWCKYEMGIRGEDDDRQISRWQDFTGMTGRWRHRIYSMIYTTKDWDSSPRIQQSLLHWGYEVNREDYRQWCSSNYKTLEDDEWCHYGGLPSPKAYMTY